jgi:hypothetical protein
MFGRRHRKHRVNTIRPPARCIGGRLAASKPGSTHEPVADEPEHPACRLGDASRTSSVPTPTRRTVRERLVLLAVLEEAERPALAELRGVIANDLAHRRGIP